MTGNSLEDAVNDEFSGYEKEVLLAIRKIVSAFSYLSQINYHVIRFTVRCADSKAEYFAHRLHQAISGAGTKDRTLIRVVVSRSDIDLGNIKREYERLFESNLVNDVTVRQTCDSCSVRHFINQNNLVTE